MTKWDTWRNAQVRRRVRFSWAIATGLVGLIVLALWIAGWTGLVSLSDKPGDAIAVKLGSPEGENLPLNVTPLPDPAFVPEPQPRPVESKTSSNQLPPVQPPQPASASSTRTPTLPHPPAPSGQNAVQNVVKGQETGNAMETVFQGGSGHVGRSLYVPIYLYMPLPSKVETSLVNRIPDSRDGFQTAKARRETLALWYEFSGGLWKLKAQPPFDSRPSLWLILQDAGYDPTTAEYKTVRALSPVTLRFTLSAPKAGQPPALLDVSLANSSGDPAVDAAVQYGFRMSAFANGTGQDAKGIFTYDFSGK